MRRDLASGFISLKGLFVNCEFVSRSVNDYVGEELVFFRQCLEKEGGGGCNPAVLVHMDRSDKQRYWCRL